MEDHPVKKCSNCLRLAVLFLFYLIMTVPEGNAQTLRQLADRHGIFYGAAVGSAFWGADSQYKETIKRECNIIVAENVMKFALIEPRQNQFNWTRADDLVAFALKNNMKIRGHNLVWHSQSEWASKVNGSRDEMIAIMRNHILAVAGRYRGKIYEWDVVNEAIDDGNGFLRDTFWKQRIGEDYIDLAFRFAHEADPEALLVYNDYSGEDMGAKSDKIYKLVSGMKQRGIPIHVVGLQCHFTFGKLPNAGDIDKNIKRLAALGLQVSITELDIRMQMPADSAKLDEQGKEYQALMTVFLNNPACKSFLTWGITDKYSWIPQFFKGYGAGLPIDENYKAKPAYEGMKTALQGKGLMRK